MVSEFSRGSLEQPDLFSPPGDLFSLTNSRLGPFTKPQYSHTGVIARRLILEERHQKSDIDCINEPLRCYCASTQVSDPTSLTDTFEKKIRAGLPSAVPRWSVETSRGPDFL
jgi:hypothetical protein